MNSRQDTWERRAEWPLTAMAVVFLVAYAWPILDPHLARPLLDACRVAAWVAWGAFALDYAVRLSLSQDRLRFVLGHLLDLAVVVLPLLRPLRLLRLITLLAVLNRYARVSLRGRVAVYVVGSTALVILVAALAEVDAERGHAGAVIQTFGDAIWWAITTVTTVGYGDLYPVTLTGRLIAGGLMLAGIALLGVVTASLASWLIERVRQVGEESEAATHRDIAALTAEVARLRDEVTALRRHGAGPEQRD